MKKVSYLTALRGWAVLGVVLVHAGIWSAGLPDWISNITDKGKYGVQLFFLLSAFTLFLSMHYRKGKGDSKLNFFIRRFFRIAPLFYLALLVYSLEKIALSKVGLSDTYDFSIGNILGTLSFIGNGFNPAWINSLVPGGWSITVEMTFYLLVPYLFTRIKNLKQALYLFLTSALISIFLHYSLISKTTSFNEYIWIEFLYYWFPNQFPVFCLGIAAFYLWNEGYLNKITHKLFISKMILILVPISIIVLSFIGNEFSQLHLVFAVLFLLVMIALELESDKFMVNKFTTYLGEISFSIYLTHFLVLDIVRLLLKILTLETALNSTSYFVLLFFITILITIPVSHFTYKFIEEYGNRAGKVLIRYLENKKETRAPIINSSDL